MIQPGYARNQNSPKLPGDGSAITITLSQGQDPASTRVAGAYRIIAEDRAQLAPGPVRPQVWLLAIGRSSRRVWLGQPGGQAVVFAGEEPDGNLEGWFQISLGACCGLPAKFVGTLEVIPVLGFLNGEAVSITYRD